MLTLKKRNKQNIAFLGIGTNKGDREKNISIALKLLSKNKNIKLLKVSNMLKNPPQEGIKSGYFLNGAIKLRTSLNPYALLRFCKRIERKLGRGLSKRRNGETARRRNKKPRTIDLDILFYGKEIINTEKLTIPHPMLHKRYFVLIPLMEVGRNYIHPTFKKSAKQLYEELNKSFLKKYA